MSYSVELVKGASVIPSESRRECEGIMSKIYKENPSYWPHGLSISGHDGGVYMIREASTKEPVGFVGWQERLEDEKKTGYYTIGVLPEYRGQGFAKEAVASIIDLKSKSVDTVKAYIMPNNTPSLKLAESLNIPIVKAASITKKATPAVLPSRMAKWGIGTGLFNAGLWDAFYNSKKPDFNFKDYYMSGKHLDSDRLGLAAVNGVLGGVGGMAAGAKHSLAESLATGGTAVAASPIKDLVINAISLQPNFRKALDSAGQASRPFYKHPALLGALGGAGLLSAGLLAAGRLNRPAPSAFEGGKVRLRLPTKNPRDQETTVELPLGALNLPSNLQRNLSRDTRRKLREESMERTWRRGQDGKMITRYNTEEAKMTADAPPEESFDEEKKAAVNALPLPDRIKPLFNYFNQMYR